MDYFMNRELCESLRVDLPPALRAELDALLSGWEQEITTVNVRRHYPPDVSRLLDSDDAFSTAGIGFPLYRIGGLHPDYQTLIRLGLPGLRRKIGDRLASDDGSAGVVSRSVAFELGFDRGRHRPLPQQRGGKGP